MSIIYGQLVNGIGLMGLGLCGLVKPDLTATLLNGILSSVPYIDQFPSSFATPFAKLALFSTFYLGTIYTGLSSSREFAKYTIKSRLYLFPVVAGISIQLLGVSNAVLAFAALDIPCALWSQAQLSKEQAPTTTCSNVSKAKTILKNALVSRDRDFKMILVVNTDLKMKKGKIAAQTAHAAVGVLDEPGAREDPIVIAWQRYGCAKVALKASFEQMKQIEDLADQAGIRNYTVHDAGRTQIAAGSQTVCAVGPMDVEEIDKITGRGGVVPLKLL